MKSVLSAERLGQAARYDHQLTVPVLPSVRLGVRLRREGDSVVLLGSTKGQKLSGAFATTHLQPLFDACDGTTSHARIAARIDLPEEQVFQALALLWAAGAIEEGPADPDAAAGVPDEVACLLSRVGDVTSANASWTTAADRLRTAKVSLLGDADLCADVAAAMDDVLAPDLSADPDALRASSLVVFLETTASAADVADAARVCWEARVPFLRVRVTGTKMWMGPYIDPEFTPCYDCATAAEDTPTECVPAYRRLAVGLAARELVALVSRAASTHLPGDTRETDLERVAVTYRPSTTRPGCPACSILSGPVAARAPLSADYEQSVAVPPKAFTDMKGHLAHFRSSNLALQLEFRSWPSCPRIPLPTTGLERLSAVRVGEAAAEKAPLTMESLAVVLLLACGLKPDQSPNAKVRRWTAAGGNIGSVTAYLVIDEPSLGLRGTYAYVDRTHELALVSEDVPRGDHQALVVITGNVPKVAKKYFSFAFRITLQDGACSATTGRLAARALGLDCPPLSDWDDWALASACGADPLLEPITNVFALEGTDAE